MQEKKFTRAKKVIDALRNHYGESVGVFAERLGVGASTVSTWASRDSLDENLIFRKCEGVNFDFLITGEGEMYSVHEENTAFKANKVYSPVLSPEEDVLLRRFRNLDEKHKLQLVEMAELYEGFCSKSIEKEKTERGSMASNFG